MPTLRRSTGRGTDSVGLDFTAERAAEALRAAASVTSSADSFRPVLDLAIRTGNWNAATVSMLGNDASVQTVAASAQSAERVDRRQYELGDGPCFAAINTGALIAVQDIAGDQRWPDWARFAAEMGMTAAVSAPLFTDGTIGALNLYRLESAGGDMRERGLAGAELLAAHASVLLAHFRAMQNLRGAIDTRNLIGQAQGILMERYRLSPSTAFAVLRRYSNQCNCKVVAVAEELIATGRLPQLQTGLTTVAPGHRQVMTQTPDLPDPAEETDEIPNPSTGVGLGADNEPDTFEPEESPE